MKVREYLEQFVTKGNVTFIIARAIKDTNSPFYHAEYRTTPQFSLIELKENVLFQSLIAP